MSNSRIVRTVAGLVVGSLVLVTSGCSTVQEVLPFGDAFWSEKDFEKGFEAIRAEASTDQLVQASAITGALTATVLTDSGEAEYLMWDFEDREVIRGTNPDDEPGYADPKVTAASAFGFDDLPIATIVERDACERDYFTFTQRSVGVGGSHIYLLTECFDQSEATTGEYHDYIDGEPVVDPDLTDPAALAGVAADAIEYAGQPAELGAVTLGYSTDTGGMEFSYSAATTTAENLEGFPCQMHYTRTTEMKSGYAGSVQTNCRNPNDSDLGELIPYEASAFDPEVMVQLWNSEVGARGAADEHPSVTLMKDLEGTLRYEVRTPGQVSHFDPTGKPLKTR